VKYQGATFLNDKYTFKKNKRQKVKTGPVQWWNPLGMGRLNIDGKGG
jgi:hypothetical protein